MVIVEMIITEVKPIDEILGFLESSKKVLFVGCDGCTQPPRGLKEASLYAKLIEMGGKLKNKTLEINATTVAVSCDNNLISTTLRPQVADVDTIVSFACGIGVQAITEVFPEKTCFPAQNSMFYGLQEREQGKMLERCRACGNCIRNGPCGGNVKGKCEVGGYTKPCAWIDIYDRLKSIDRLDLFEKFHPPRDYKTAQWPREINNLVE
jgi:hypothetical protein